MLNDYGATIWEIEDIILGMAEIVMECRQLRRENAELIEFKEKYQKELNQRFEDSQKQAGIALKMALEGCINRATEDRKLLKVAEEIHKEGIQL